MRRDLPSEGDRAHEVVRPTNPYPEDGVHVVGVSRVVAAESVPDSRVDAVAAGDLPSVRSEATVSQDGLLRLEAGRESLTERKARDMRCIESVSIAGQPWKIFCGEPATEIRVVDGKKEHMCTKHARKFDKKRKRP